MKKKSWANWFVERAEQRYWDEVFPTLFDDPLVKYKQRIYYFKDNREGK